MGKVAKTVKSSHSSASKPRKSVRQLPTVPWKKMKSVYAILNERYNSGDPTLSAKHNEHQP